MNKYSFEGYTEHLLSYLSDEYYSDNTKPDACDKIYDIMQKIKEDRRVRQEQLESAREGSLSWSAG